MNETEADTRANRIDPVLRQAGWGVAWKRRGGAMRFPEKFLDSVICLSNC